MKKKLNRFICFNIVYKLYALWSSQNLEIICKICCFQKRVLTAIARREEINDDDPLLLDTIPLLVSHNVIMSTCRLPSMCVVITYNINMCHIYTYISTYVRRAYASRLVKGLYYCYYFTV